MNPRRYLTRHSPTSAVLAAIALAITIAPTALAQSGTPTTINNVQIQGTGNGLPLARPQPILVIGNTQYSVQQLVALDSYRANRPALLARVALEVDGVRYAAALNEVSSRESVRDAAREADTRAGALDLSAMLRELAIADLSQLTAELAAQVADLRMYQEYNRSGESLPFQELRVHQIKLAPLLAELEVAKETFGELAAHLAPYLDRIAALQDGLEGMRFRVLHNGFIRDDVTLDSLTSPELENFETLLARVRQGTNLPSHSRQLQQAVFYFGQEAWRALTEFHDMVDWLSYRKRFKAVGADSLKAKVDDHLLMLNFVRARIGLPQEVPHVQGGGIWFNSFVIGENNPRGETAVGTQRAIAEERMRIEELKNKGGGLLNYASSRPREVKMWFLDKLAHQMDLELAFRADGREAEIVRDSINDEDIARIRQMLNRPSRTPAAEHFLEVLVQLKAWYRFEAQNRNLTDVTPAFFDDLIGGVDLP